MIAQRTARILTKHPGLVWLCVVVMVVSSGAILLTKGRFASDILDLLPEQLDSVRTFKIFDREFTQARELTFALYDAEGTADLDAFTDHFTEALRREPWVVRAMDRSPIETETGMAEVQRIAVPLLLNLPPETFAQAVQVLAPEAIEARVDRLRQELEAGSPKAEFTADFDPLGLVGPALKPLAGSFSMEQTRPLSSPDGRVRVVLAITTQQDLGAKACQGTMNLVDDFQRRVVASWEGVRPEVLVTGRTPYVAELSLKMRSDVISTLFSSVVQVALMFYIGFRRIRPLLSIVHVLLLCCLMAVALGALFFGELNMITIGLGAILIGLGVDFGMVLYALYQSERERGTSHEDAIASALRHHGSGIIFGAMTTGAAFLCLLRSDCAGFAQLGVLIAVGILCTAAVMMTAFFIFNGSSHKPLARDLLSGVGDRHLGWIAGNPDRATAIGLAVLLLVSAVGYLPIGQLRFDANPRSLEPADSKAGRALRTITSHMPAVGEPIVALVQASDADDSYQKWKVLDARWKALLAEGVLKSVATPAPFVMSPSHLKANAGLLSGERLRVAREALDAAIVRHGLNAEGFAHAFQFIDSLAAVSRGERDVLAWKQALPQDSSWWFVLDHFFGNTPHTASAFITPAGSLADPQYKARLEKQLVPEGYDVHLSGWSYTLADLIPWSKGKLLELTLLMIGLNLVLLFWLFRKTETVLLLFASLGLAIGGLLASLKVLGVSLNLFNVLAFPLVLGVGVDYGIYVALAARGGLGVRRALTPLYRPLLLSGLTTAVGFGSLAWAQNPALRGLGIVCALGVAWCFLSTFFFVLPYAMRKGAMDGSNGAGKPHPDRLPEDALAADAQA